MRGGIRITALSACLLASSLATSQGVMADEVLTDSFKNHPERDWRFFADTVMGGISTGNVVFGSKDGAYVRLTGNVSTAKNGGFIQIRKQLPSARPKGISGIRLVARGNGQRYFIHLRTRGTLLPWQYYQSGFEVSGNWKEFRLPFTSFNRSGRLLAKTPAPSSLKSVAIVAFGRDHTADVQVKEIGFY